VKSTGPDIQAGADFGVHLAGQVDFNRGIDGAEAVLLGQRVDAMGDRRLSEEDVAVAVGELKQPSAAKQRTRNALAGMRALACVRHRPPQHQVGHAVNEDAGVNAEVTVCAQRAADRFHQAANAHLQRRAVDDQFRHVAGYTLGHRIDRCSRRLDQWLVGLDVVIDA
jgi:hypothetical protein